MYKKDLESKTVDLKESTAIIPGEGCFFGTHKTKEEADTQAKVWGLVVRSFGVYLDCVDPGTKVATKWHKTEGYSTWG